MPIIYNMLCWEPSVRNYVDRFNEALLFCTISEIFFDRFYDAFISMNTFRDFG